MQIGGKIQHAYLSQQSESANRRIDIQSRSKAGADKHGHELILVKMHVFLDACVQRANGAKAKAAKAGGPLLQVVSLTKSIRFRIPKPQAVARECISNSYCGAPTRAAGWIECTDPVEV